MPDPPLAIDGGVPAFPEGPPPWPRHQPAIQQALLASWESGAWGRYHGGGVERLEAELCRYTQSAYAMTCCSGTFAVELALRALHVGTGDEVILAGYDFPGNFRAVESVGAKPVLVDLARQGWSVTAECLEPAWNSRTRAVLLSHLHGDLIQIPLIVEAARRHGAFVVEDACQAPGAWLNAAPVGSLGDVGVFSFGGSKLLTAGRGGALLTQDERIWQRAKIFCERGNDAFPLSELQAAVLTPQLEQLAADTLRRAENVQRLLAATRANQLLVATGGISVADRERPETHRRTCPAYYKLGWTVRAEATRRSREELIAAAHAEGVALDAGFRGFTRRTTRRCRIATPLINAERASLSTVLLHHPILLGDEPTIDRLANAIQRLDRWLAC